MITARTFVPTHDRRQSGDVTILNFEAVYDDEFVLTNGGVNVADKLRTDPNALDLVVVKSPSEDEKSIQKVLAVAAQYLLNADPGFPMENAITLRHVHNSSCLMDLSLPSRTRPHQQHSTLDSGESLLKPSVFQELTNQLQIFRKKSPYDFYLLHHHVLTNDVDELNKKLMGQQRVDINARDEAGWTALNLAILLGKSEVVKMLLDHGANTTSDKAQRLPDFVCGAWDRDFLMEVSPLILSVRLNLKNIVELLTHGNRSHSEMDICIRMSYGMNVESTLLASVCKQAEQMYADIGARFRPTYTTKQKKTRVCLGFSDAVCGIEKKEKIHGVNIVIMNMDISQKSSWVKGEGILKEEEEVVCSSLINLWATDLWNQHPNLNAITAGSIAHVKYPERGFAGHIILYCSHKGYIPLESIPFPTHLKSDDGKSMPIAVLEGKFRLGPRSNQLVSLQDGEANAASDTTEVNGAHGMQRNSERTQMTTARHIPLKIGMHVCKRCKPNDIICYEGTLGTFVDMENGKTGFITCAHLFFKDEISRKKQPIQMHFTSSPNKCGDDVIAPFDHFEEIVLRGVADMEDDAHPNNTAGDNIENRNAYWECGKVVQAVFDSTETGIDAALIEIDPIRVPRDGSFDYVSSTHLREAEMSQLPLFTSGKQADKTYLDSLFAENQGRPIRCMKLGASSGLSVGVLTWRGGQVRTDDASLGMEQGSTIKHIMKGQYVISDFKNIQFFKCGDSGSAVFVMKKSGANNPTYFPDACLGIAIGFVDKETFVTPIGSILKKFDSKNVQPLKLTKFT